MRKFFCKQCVDPDQMPHSALSDLGLHCLPVSHLWVFRLKWVIFPLERLIVTSVRGQDRFVRKRVFNLR